MFKKNKKTTDPVESQAAETKAINKEKPKKEKPAPKEKSSKETRLKEKADKKATKLKDRKNSKIEADKSELAKNLGIRISNPYGYYPDDVDPIIQKLQNDVASLTRENKQLTDQVADLTKKNKSLSSELSQLKIQVSLMEVPSLSMEEGLLGMSKLNAITGNHYDESIPDLAATLLNDDPPIELPEPEIEEPAKSKPVIKLKNKNGGNK